MTMNRPHAVLAAAFLAAVAGSASAQNALLSNQSADPSVAPLSTGATAANGATAPAGTLWSELQSDAGAANATGGLAVHGAGSGGAFRLADNFTIPAAWHIDHVKLYAYQPGAAANPFASVTLRIWTGRPGDAGSTVVWGDTSTNRLASVSATNLYRVFNSAAAPAPMAPDTSKPIWELNVSTALVQLQPGTYWLDWQIVPANTALEVFAPTVTKAGLRTVAGANARQFGPSGWADALDAGKPASAADVNVELPFVLMGYPGQPPCSSDYNGDGDHGTDQDIEAFFACIGGTCCPACGPSDYNSDGDAGTDQDIEAFFRVLGGNPC
ncbi:MAG TPA: hypothetical protein VD997_05600 [Phycisphaerales bacterium]|nr:hypothetical protein [Phycisphaerales bacterium]